MDVERGALSRACCRPTLRTLCLCTSMPLTRTAECDQVAICVELPAAWLTLLQPHFIPVVLHCSSASSLVVSERTCLVAPAGHPSCLAAVVVVIVGYVRTRVWH